jgi:outer membrane protein assembly factor BamB
MTSQRTLRLWPGVALAILVVLLRFVAILMPDDVWLADMPVVIIGILGSMICALAIGLWWIFFSRAPWTDRIAATVVMVIALAVTSRIVHESIAGGMMGMLLYIYAIPAVGVALVIWAVATRGCSNGTRRAWMVAAVVLACAPWVVLRTAGSLGAGSDFHWRWTATPEQRLLAQGEDTPRPLPQPPPAPEAPTEPAASKAVVDPTSAKRESAAAATATGRPDPSPAVARFDAASANDPRSKEADWPGFRGPKRDGIVRGLRIDTDWTRSQPVQLWRRPVGPGWGSFAVEGDLFYTQEQRGEHEVVACHRVSTGEPVWRHRDTIRFYESNGGAGPRATPTLSNSRVYTIGATGVVNALNAATGAVVWSRNAATDTGVEVPDWGFSGSPLVIDDLVIVAMSGQLIAYAAATGDRRWLGPEGGAGYSSPHLATIDGVPQVLLLRGSRTISVAPADGKVLWEHVWLPGVGIVQPGLTDGGDVLLTNGEGMGGIGIRRIALQHGSGGWTVQERWTTRGLKPYFNDFVVHKGHAYGFDGSILASIGLDDGERKWKGGRYGNGQLILLADQDVLLVLSEEGELALVSATPDQFKELARVKTIEGKTWNHPAVVGNTLLVRNGEEMAAYRLPVVGR